MVHMKTKCPKLGYGDEDVKKLKTSFKRVGEFKVVLWAREKKNREENEIKKAGIITSKFAESVKLALESKVTSGVTPGATTQLAKTRQPPLLSGEHFDRWRVEMERWCDSKI